MLGAASTFIGHVRAGSHARPVHRRHRSVALLGTISKALAQNANITKLPCTVTRFVKNLTRSGLGS